MNPSAQRPPVLRHIVTFSGCSKTGGTKPPASEQAGARPGAVGTGGAGANVKSDGDFVRDVAVKNMAEVELSRMALDKARNLDIKSFAQTVIDDHSAAVSKLKNVVSGQPIEWPAQLDEKHRKTADELAQKQGANFDRDYVTAMVEGHQDLTAKLESDSTCSRSRTGKRPRRDAPTARRCPSPKTQCATCRSVPTAYELTDHAVTHRNVKRRRLEVERTEVRHVTSTLARELLRPVYE